MNCGRRQRKVEVLCRVHPSWWQCLSHSTMYCYLFHDSACLTAQCTVMSFMTVLVSQHNVLLCLSWQGLSHSTMYCYPVMTVLVSQHNVLLSLSWQCLSHSTMHSYLCHDSACLTAQCTVISVMTVLVSQHNALLSLSWQCLSHSTMHCYLFHDSACVTAQCTVISIMTVLVSQHNVISSIVAPDYPFYLRVMINMTRVVDSIAI